MIGNQMFLLMLNLLALSLIPLLRSHDTLVRWSVAVGLFSRFKCGDGRGSVEFCASGGKGSYVKCVIFILVPLGFLLPFLNHVSLTWKMR